jgi:hypothetical protein
VKEGGTERKKPGNGKAGNVRNRKEGRVDRKGGRVETGKEKNWKEEGRKGGQKGMKAGNRKRGKVGNGNREGTKQERREGGQEGRKAENKKVKNRKRGKMDRKG